MLLSAFFAFFFRRFGLYSGGSANVGVDKVDPGIPLYFLAIYFLLKATHSSVAVFAMVVISDCFPEPH